METTIANLLDAAMKCGASDLHITAGIKPKCRVNGELVEMQDFDTLCQDKTKEIIFETLTPYHRAILEEKGEVDYSYELTDKARFRVNAFRQRGSYAAALRIINNDIPSAASLGIPASVVELVHKKRGLVLVTGPTGSGKSTTLASLIDLINKEQNVHIVTLEDPIEYLHKHNKAIVNQREVGSDTNSFANALRAALREDPDVILVGEMRDLDTISTAITAAETGHLIFATLHTIGAAATIDRIIDVFPPHQQPQVRVQLSMVLESVISQRLLPTRDGKGRVAAFEVMNGSTAIKNLVREGKTHQIDAAIQTSKKMGMQTMDDALYDLYLKYKIDGMKAIEYAQNPVAMQEKIY